MYNNIILYTYYGPIRILLLLLQLLLLLYYSGARGLR